ncbi:SDR family NAD(P)-dependent oxidoreductase [Pseudothauera nasutitermitis]|uniref:SDR family NAD(P)-dependent oxidoreductase n=1 Tax=Pseudothauera nasutitermitis TaxID=2565930 RepID=A0A4S4B5Z5_9RHOO|nr:NAD(P)H-binding protein [Pseudothauera nasutitermitis]THF67236.1 SDR family NAD(P)-dependent oxidoreductase [Pseudothauera nasutitermitis]
MSAPSLIVFGARKGAGLAVAQAARAAGWAVTVVVRPGADASALSAAGCQVREADALDTAAVSESFAGLPSAAWVVSTLGGFDPVVDNFGNRNVIAAARAHGVQGMLLVSSLGAGDSRAYASPKLVAAIGPVLDAKTRAEDALRASGLAFAIVRPGGLVDGQASGSGQLVEAQDVHGYLSRTELASLILRLLAGGGLSGQTLAAIDPACPPPARYA